MMPLAVLAPVTTPTAELVVIVPRGPQSPLATFRNGSSSAQSPRRVAV